MSKGTRAQGHVLYVRPTINAILPDPMNTTTPYLPKAKNVKDLKAIIAKQAKEHTGKGNGWYFAIVRGHLGIAFESPLRWRDVDRAVYEGIVGAGKRNKFVEDFEASDGKKHKPTDIIIGQSMLLTNTSKMGCYSWNLPAGPPKHGGCCPGSVMGFDHKILGLKENADLRGVKLLAAIRRLTKTASGEYLENIPISPKEAVDRFICNGCYAMKGAYGNPSVITVMEWRKKWLQGFALPTGQFHEVMVNAILIAQTMSISQRKIAKTREKYLNIPNPQFMRIHDSGDFFSPEYMEQWFEICRDPRMKDVHFWAPTRIWTSSSGAKLIERVIATGKFPKNLAMRPSGTFFDAPEPYIPSMAGGTSSNRITFNTKNGKIHLDIDATGPDTWGCPAYLPEIIGGGAPATTQDDFYKAVYDKKRKRFVIDPRTGVPMKATKANYAKYPKVKAKIDSKQYEVQKAEKPLQNPVRTFRVAMYPHYDDLTKESKNFVFYDAVFDRKKKVFVIDPETARPMKATATIYKKYPEVKAKVASGEYTVKKSQAYKVSGSCAMAVDGNKKEECRVCWGTSGGQRSESMRLLPVVYGRH